MVPEYRFTSENSDIFRYQPLCALARIHNLWGTESGHFLDPQTGHFLDTKRVTFGGPNGSLFGPQTSHFSGPQTVAFWTPNGSLFGVGRGGVHRPANELRKKQNLVTT